MGKSEITQDLQEAIRKKDWRGAVNALKRLVKLEPRNAPHRLRMGEYYVKLKDNGKAIASYQKAAELFGEDGFIVKALAAYKIILRLDPGNQRARSGMEGLHSEAKEQALELSVSLPRTPSFSSRAVSSGVGPGKGQVPVMDAWEISKSHLLKDIEAPAGGPPAGSFPQGGKPFSPSTAPPVPDKGGSPPPVSEKSVSPPPAPPEPEKVISPPAGPVGQEDLQEALIGSSPIDFDSYEKDRKAEAGNVEGPSPVYAGSSDPDIPVSEAEPESPPGDLPEAPSEIHAEKSMEEPVKGSQAPPPVQPIIPSGGAGSNVLTLFSSLTKEEFAEVADRMNPYLFDPGSKIVSEGDTGDSVFVVSSGTVQVSTTVGDREVVLAELKDDDFFGEVSFLTGRPRTANIVASTATEILELPGDDLRAVVEKFPRVHAVLEEFHRVRALDTVEKIMPPGEKGRGDAD